MVNILGYFDQQLRENLFTTWSSHLQQAGLEFRQDLARTEVGRPRKIFCTCRCRPYL